MSQFYTSFFTVWTASARNVRSGNVTYGNPTVFKGLMKQGGNLKLTDSTGQEFYPSSTYWSGLEVVTGSITIPDIDDLIAFGDQRNVSDPTTIKAQQIRGRTIFDNSMFNNTTDYVFGTK